MLSEQLEHVVEEMDSRRDVVLAFPHDAQLASICVSLVFLTMEAFFMMRSTCDVGQDLL